MPMLQESSLRQTAHRVVAAGRKRTGATAMEFAVLAPFLVMLVLGSVECGRAVQVRGILQNAARKACRTGIKPGSTSAAMTAEVNNILQDKKLNASKAKITILVNNASADASTATRNDVISVKVSVGFGDVAWTTPILLNRTLLESETVVMMRQG